MKAAKCVAGVVEIVDVDIAAVPDSYLLVQMEYSALSTGTELMLLRNKATTMLGNSGTGVVLQAGKEVTHAQVGQRVAIYGVFAHAERVLVPKHLCVPVPAHVDPLEAAFTGVATIAVQALRQADLRFGETVVIAGLGILGQLIAQIAHAAACQVIALDLLPERCELLARTGSGYAARTTGELQAEVDRRTGGYGADCVMICAGSKTERMIDRGLEWLRDRGKIVIVGDTNTTFERNALFAKEATVTISRAGGPGRSDPNYEQKGIDYPYGYVRWTEGRNIAEFIRLLAERRLNLHPLITHQYTFGEIKEAYRQSIESPRETLGVIIRY
ncbi:zinc-dependent alcohol dehydrogenase [Paenibacillus cymbidii]|uniref:zinc-dependent alcohol dehydrogenase n=1 Tax=Paenibacillus cymbidii TaxID=1639034 RepID=UPI0010815F28|nr:zinc-binding alcohol dehydrogenase [Paenibacillus cymbidii]